MSLKNRIRESVTSVDGWRNIFMYLFFFSMPLSISAGTLFGLLIILMTLIQFVIGKEKWQPTIIVYGMAVFLLGAELSIFLYSEPSDYLSDNREFYRFLIPFAVFFSLKTRNTTSYFWVFFVALTLHASYALTLQLSDSPIRSGFFDNHLTYGGVILLPLSLMLSLLFYKTQALSVRIILLILFTLCFLSLLLSLSRSNLVGFGVSCIVMLIFIRPKTALFGTMAFLLFVGAWLNSSSLREQLRFNNVGIVQSLVAKTHNLAGYYYRLHMLEAGKLALKGYYFTGIGPNSHEHLDKFYDQVRQEGRFIDHPASVGVHNIYLQIWLDYGLLGLLGYIMIWLGLFLAIWFTMQRKIAVTTVHSAYLRGIFAGVAGFLVAGFFENNFFDGEVQMVVLAFTGIALVLIEQIRGMKKLRL